MALTNSDVHKGMLLVQTPSRSGEGIYSLCMLPQSDADGSGDCCLKKSESVVVDCECNQQGQTSKCSNLWALKAACGKVPCDDQGVAVKHQLVGNGFNGYWGHHYARLLVMVKVPAFGYSTYILSEAKGGIDLYRQKDQRVDREIRDQFSLENEKLKVVFHPVNGSILSLIDKASGDELVDTKQATGIFRLIHEDTNKWMTAWWVGRYMRVENLHEKNVVIKKVYDESSPLRANHIRH